MPDPMLYSVDPKKYCALLWKFVRESDEYNGVAIIQGLPLPTYILENENEA